MELFTHDFDEEADAAVHAAKTATPRYYSEDDLARAITAAREDAFQEGRVAGHADGRAEATGEIEAQAAAALEALTPALAGLLADISTHQAALEEHLRVFALLVCERVFPKAIEKLGKARVATEVENLIAACLSESSLVVTLSPETADAISARLQSVANLSGRGHLIIRSDDNLDNGEVQVSWEDGFMSYNFPAVCAGILNSLRCLARS